MTKQQATKRFRRDVLPGIQVLFGEDRKARTAAWRCFTESLACDGEITTEQRKQWAREDGAK